jgi:uncharacterized small protein (DUF1192 family)
MAETEKEVVVIDVSSIQNTAERIAAVIIAKFHEQDARITQLEEEVKRLKNELMDLKK